MLMYESNEYRASKNWPYAISAGCVVYRPTKNGFEVLLLERDAKKHKWGRHGGQDISYHLAKGHVERNETLEQTALRETEEEAGVKGEITTYLGARLDIFQHPNTGMATEKVVHYFALDFQKELSQMDDEHTSKKWFSLDGAMVFLGEPNPKGEDEIVKRLKKFLELTHG